MNSENNSIPFRVGMTFSKRRFAMITSKGMVFKVSLTLAIIVLLVLNQHHIWDWVVFITNRDAFSEYILGFGIWGPLVITGFNFLHVIVALVPGHAVVMASGYIYGLIPGFFLNHISMVSASLVAFYLARWFGRPLVVRLVPKDTVDRWDRAAHGHGFAFFLTCYLLPLFPADVMNFVAGFSSLSVGKFLLANLLGRAYLTLAVTAMGAYGQEIIELGIPVWGWVLFLVISAVTYWTWRFKYSRKLEERLTDHQQGDVS